jgi:hypothetical protein
VPISAKSLKPAQQARVRSALAEEAAKYPNQSEIAAKLGVKQQTVSAIINGGTVGVKVAMALATLRRQTLDDLLGGAPKAKTYGELEGWKEAAEQALRERLVRRYTIDAVQAWPVNLAVPRASLHLLLDLCNLWVKWTPQEIRAALETQEAAEELERVTRAGVTRAGEVKADRPRHGQKTS